MKAVALAILLLSATLALGASSKPKGQKPATCGTCTGSDTCTACTTCRYCKHCAVLGGTCGVKKQLGQ